MTIDTNNWFANLGNFEVRPCRVPTSSEPDGRAGESGAEAVRPESPRNRRRRQGECQAFVTAGRIAATGAKSLAQTSSLAAVKASSRLRTPSDSGRQVADGILPAAERNRPHVV